MAEPEETEVVLRSLPPGQVAEVQRERIIDGVAHAIRSHGYLRTTVEHMIEPAGVSRRTFYEIFSDKADAFCAAYVDAVDHLEAAIRSEAARESEWPLQVAAAIQSGLDHAAANPTRAYLISAEPLSAGPRMSYCHDLLMQRFGPDLRRGWASVGLDPPASVDEGMIAGLTVVVGKHLRSEPARELPALAPQLTTLVLTPYVGIERANQIARR